MPGDTLKPLSINHNFQILYSSRLRCRWTPLIFFLPSIALFWWLEEMDLRTVYRRLVGMETPPPSLIDLTKREESGVAS